MKKIAFLFPGQGAQYVGMGAGFYENSGAVREIYEMASEAAGVNIADLCLKQNEEIHKTEYTQIAILATEAALLKLVQDKGIVPDICAGISLGEYAALIASGVLSRKDAFSVVRKRGLFMQEAYPTGGAMMAVIGGEIETIEKVCLTCSALGIVSVANYNCPGQAVISGEEAAVKAAAEKLMDHGVRKCISLKVSGPFHTKLLEGAGTKLREVLAHIPVNEIEIPYLSNTLAEIVTDKSMVRELLVRQVSEAVRWEQSVRRMLEEGVTDFVEIGPGRTLAGFVKKIDRTARVINIDKYEDFEQSMEKLFN